MKIFQWVGEEPDSSIEQIVSKLFDLEEEAWYFSSCYFCARTSNGLKIALKFERERYFAEYILYADDQRIATLQVKGSAIERGYLGIKELYEHLQRISHKKYEERSDAEAKKRANKLRQRRDNALDRF